MLPFDAESSDAADYRARLGLLEKWGVVRQPSIKKRQPAAILDEGFLAELSFLYFCAWLFLSTYNRPQRLVRASVVPASADGSSSLLVISKMGTPLAAPGRETGDLLIDD